MDWFTRTIAPWAHRDTHRCLSWRNRIYVAYGYGYGNVTRMDMWWTGETIKWFNSHSTLPFPAYTPMTIHKGDMYFVHQGGVSKCVDGVSFVTVRGPFHPQNDFTTNFGNSKLVSMGDSLVLVAPTLIAISWDDGVTWMVYPTPWLGAIAPTCPTMNELENFDVLVFNGKLHVFAGVILDIAEPAEAGYVYYTSRSTIWSTYSPEVLASWEAEEGPWAPRSWPSVAEHKGEMWLSCGFSNVSGTNLNDLWRKGPTGLWERVPLLTNHVGKHGASLLSFNGELLSIGGNRNPDGGGITTSEVLYLRENP